VSTPIFERLLYTDCRAGEGLGSAGGLQIQAKSNGVDSTQSDMAVGLLTYSIQSKWVAEERAVKDYPAGFAHAAAAGFGTSQSLYLGPGVSDPRDGNHLADCLLTRDPAGYGAIRPAQLWRSEVWTDRPWPTTEAPAFDGWLETGPLDNDAIADWLRLKPSRARALGQLLTVLEDPSGQPVFIRSDTPEDALYWIAAATILLPIEQALGISFRVFNKNRDELGFRILGLPAELHPPLASTPRQGTFQLDDAAGTCDDVAVSERAAHWVELLARADEPYDVVSAVQIASEIVVEGTSDPYKLADARAVAWFIAAAEENLDNLTPLLRWLSSASPERIKNYGRAIAGRVLADAGATAQDLSIVDALVAGGAIELDIGSVRIQLIQAEVRKIQAGGAVPFGPLSQVPLAAQLIRDVHAAVSSAMVVGTDDEVAQLLALVGRHRLTLSPISPALRVRLHEFVQNWIRIPGKYAYDSLRLQDSFVLDEIHSQLIDLSTNSRNVDFLTALQAFAPSLVAARNDHTDPLAWHLEACFTRSLSSDKKRSHILAVIDGAAAEGSAATPWLRNYQSALIAWRALDEAAMLVWVAALPKDIHIDPEMLAGAQRGAASWAADRNPATMWAIQALNRRGLLPRSPALITATQSLTVIDLILQRLQAASIEPRDRHTITTLLAPLSTVPADMIDPCLAQFIDIAMTAPEADVGSELLKSLPPRAADDFATVWISRHLSPPSARSILLTVAWINDYSVAEAMRARLLEGAADSLVRLTPADRDAIMTRIEPNGLGYWPDAWKWLVDAVRGALVTSSRPGQPPSANSQPSSHSTQKRSFLRRAPKP